MARQGHPRAPLMTCGDIYRIIIALFIPSLGVFTQVGLTQTFWINLVIYLFAVGGLGFSVLFGMWPAAVIHARPVCHPDSQINRVSAIWF